MEQEYGIENIKKAFSEIFRLMRVVMKALEDGKVTLVEVPGLMIAFSRVPKLVSAGREAIPEVKDLDREEARELAQWLAEEFGIGDDHVEERVQEAMQLLADTYDEVMDGIELYKKWQSWAGTLKREAA